MKYYYNYCGEKAAGVSQCLSEEPRTEEPK